MLRAMTEQGCAPDSGGVNSAASRNPIAAVVNQVLGSRELTQRADEVRLPDSLAHLSEQEAEKVRSRSSVLARQFHPHESEQVVSAEVSSMLESLQLDAQAPSERYADPALGKDGDELFADELDFLDQLDTVLGPGATGQGGMFDAYNSVPVYDFAPDNPFLDSAEPFQIGLEAAAQGNIQDAVWAFEAEVQQRPMNSDAWQQLGRLHAENDEDPIAIEALKHAVQADPDNLDALLELGVSYTNELDKTQALTLMLDWLKRHPDYDSFGLDELEQGDEALHSTLQDRVVRMFLRAAEVTQDDAEIHTVLGVLYNLSMDFDLAVESFQRALEADPNNASLWNKLGATMANDFRASKSRSEEAIRAYERALELRPTYVRAIVNLGIAYGNLQDFASAAERYGEALEMNPNAEHVWGYLKITLLCMEREDLAEMAEAQDLDVLNHL